ncbi:MAG: phage virion morphogenesis protein [Deltaproteobacteria bacterium]|nr:phage virion morphogenesis protein [Deltaproteobacteria bacterium]
MSDAIQIEGDLAERINRILSRLQHRKPMLDTIGRLGAQSVRTNFDVGGRPNTWDALKHRDGQPLRDTGRLQASFIPGAPGSIFDVAEDSVSFGTNLIYAALQNFGADKGEFGTVAASVRAHTRVTIHGTVSVRSHTRTMQTPFGKIPARRFLMLQSEDIDDAEDAAESHIMGD